MLLNNTKLEKHQSHKGFIQYNIWFIFMAFRCFVWISS